MCGCYNGRLTCTDIDECRDDNEDRDEDEMRCERCQNAAMRLVCGRDGRTYPSRCTAMNCSRLRDTDVLDGPCSNQVWLPPPYLPYLSPFPFPFLPSHTYESTLITHDKCYSLSAASTLADLDLRVFLSEVVPVSEVTDARLTREGSAVSEISASLALESDSFTSYPFTKLTTLYASRDELLHHAMLYLHKQTSCD